jgi:hypothetical protein
MATMRGPDRCIQRPPTKAAKPIKRIARKKAALTWVMPVP